MANNQLKEELVLSTGQFDKNIENVIKKVEELKNKGGKVGNGFNQSMGDMIKKATGFNGSLGSMMSVVGKLGGVFGVTASAVGVLSNAFKQNETLVDELGRQIETVGAVFDSFCIGLNNLNFDGILGNLTNIIKKAREAYDAIDKAGTNTGIRSNQGAMLRALDARDRAIVNNKKSTEAERKAAQERIKSREPLRREAARGNYTDNSNAAKKLIEKRLAEAGINKNNTDYKKIYEKVLKSFYSPNKSIGTVEYWTEGNLYNGSGRMTKVQYKNKVNLDKYFGDEFRNQVNGFIQGAWSSLEQGYNYENKMNRTTQKDITSSSSKGVSGGSNSSPLEKLKAKVEFTIDKDTDKYVSELLQEGESTLPLHLQVSKEDIIGGENKFDYGLSYDTPSTIDEYEGKIEHLQDSLRGLTIGSEGYKTVLEELNKTQAEFNNLVSNGGVSKLEGKLNNTADKIETIGSAFSSLGKSLEMPELDAAGMIASAIASIIQGYGTATSQAATLGPWAWISFALAGLSQVAAVVSSIHNLSGYAEGGIIGGSNYAGDALLARVNSGEMILNGSQQKHLFNLLDKGGTTGSANSNVQFVIRGKDLVGAINNYNNVTAKIR